MPIINREGALVLATGIDISGLQSGIDQAEGELDQFAGRAKKIGMLVGSYFGVQALKDFGKEIVNVRGEMQLLETSFGVLLGNEAKANTMLSEIKQYAIQSPLSLNGVSKAAQLLLGFNVEAEKVMPTLKQLGDISMGSTERFQSLALAFAQMSAAGKLMGQDLLQMINAGFNPLQEISLRTGKSLVELRKEMENGTISSKMVADAFASVTAEGGKFYGMTAKQAEGIRGLQAQLEGGLQDAFNNMGKSAEGAISIGYKGAISLVENYGKVGRAVAALITTYGAYKAAVVVTNIVLKEQAAINAMVVASNGVFNKSLAYQWVWTGRVQKAQALLNKTMLSNPYVLLATLVVGLGAAMWALSDNTTATERALRDYNKTKEEAAQKEQEHKAKIEELINTSTSQSEADFKRVMALDQLKKEYPKIFEKYDLENLKLADILKIKKEIAEIDGQRSLASSKENAQNIQAEIDLLTAKMNNTTGAGAAYYESVGKRIDALKGNLKLVNAEIQEQSNALWEANTPLEVKKKLIQDEITALRNQNFLIEQNNRKQFGKGILPDDVTINANKKRIEELKSQYESLSPSLEKAATKNEAYWKKIKEDAEKNLGALGTDQVGTSAWKKLQDAIRKADIELKKYSVSSLDKAGIDANKIKSETADRLVEIEEARKKIQQQEIDSELEIRAGKIAVMEDGSKKELAQIQLAYDQRMNEIAKQGNELIKQQQDIERKAWEAANPKWKEKGMVYANTTTSVTQLSPGLQGQLSDSATIAAQQRTYAEAQLLKQTLKEYQDYSARRYELEKKYNEDVAYLNSQRIEKNASQIDAALKQAKKQFDESTSSIDLEEFQKSIDWTRVFGDLDKVSTDALEKLRDKLKAYLSEASGSMTPENIKTVSDAIEDMTDKISERKPFQELSSGWNEYRQAATEAAAAQEYLNKLTKEGKEDSEDYKQTEENLANLQGKRLEGLKKVSNAASNIGKIGTQAVNAGNDIIDMLTNFGVKVPKAVSGALSGVGQVFDGLSSINVTQPFTVITGGLKVIAGLGNTIASIFGKVNKEAEDTKRIQAINERVESTQEAINKLIDKRIDLIKEATAAEANYLNTLTQNDIAQQQTYLQKQFSNLSGNDLFAKKGKNNNLTYAEVMRKYGLSDLADFAEWWNTGGYNALLADGFGIRDKDSIDSIVSSWTELGDAATEAKEAMQEAATGTTFDAMKDSLDDLVKQADLTFEDISESFEDHMSNAILNMVKSNYLTDELKKWYEKFAEDSASGGKLTADEVSRLQDYYKEIAENANKMFNDAATAMGLDLSDNSEASDNSLKGAYAKADQESINLLAGQTSAARVSLDSIRDSARSIQETMKLIYDIQTRGWKDVEIIKGLTDEIKKSNDQIVATNQQVADNTQGINKISESLKYIETHGIDLK
ncbi:tape measure protein [Parabacteroides sp. Marseille-P3160]|uniref:tape measure protein n=1 Tax=Parabacteroides sp. Marseille-P3160 TaxID=1917887 RepID=UPI0009BBD065|nr:tape measure protein [Parabacteroides sp. Marseille-P3160]